MLRERSGFKMFKNGNINLSFAKDDIKDIKSGRGDLIERLSWNMEDNDCYFVGDEFCLGNFDMGCMIYSTYTDMVYIISFTDLDDVVMKGKTLKLYARQPDEDEREIIEREVYGDSY